MRLDIGEATERTGLQITYGTYNIKYTGPEKRGPRRTASDVPGDKIEGRGTEVSVFDRSVRVLLRLSLCLSALLSLTPPTL